MCIRDRYDTADAMAAMDHFVEVDYDKWFTIDENVEVQYTDTGHIIGSSAVHLKIKENGKITRLSFSGDVGRYRDVILRSPAEFSQADSIPVSYTHLTLPTIYTV